MDATDLRSRNLEAFRHRSAALHAQLIAHVPTSRLVYDDNGQPDIVLNDVPFYKGDIHGAVREQIENYHRYSRQILLSPLSPKQFDEEAGRFLDDILVHCVENGVEFLQNPRGAQSYDLIIFGIGLGLHIAELIEKTECFAVIIADANIEFLYHSLDVCDWTAIFDRMEERDGQVRFVFSNSSQLVATAVRQNLRNINPCAADGLRYFIHYSTPLFQEALRQLRRDASLITVGLGFFFDETIMISNCHAHLYGGTARVYLRPERPRLDGTAFVVGSGPSLDQDLETIKALRDDAIVIACGSALRPLMRSGITPDFQIELENLLVSPLIDQVAADHDLSDVCLVTASTVDQTVVSRFRKVIYYFRSSLSPYAIFSNTPRHCLEHPNPTVVNAGFAFAKELGFRDIYLFGTDMGRKAGSDRHHSAHTFHYTADGERAVVDAHHMPVPGNFGGKALTSFGLYWTRDDLSQAIRLRMPGQRVFNCSDGAFIEGTIAKKSRGIRLSPLPGGHAAKARSIFESMPIYGREEFDANWSDERFRDEANRFLDGLRDLIIGVESFSTRRYLADIRRYMDPVGDRWQAGVALLFRGSFFMAFMALEYYLTRVRDPEHDAVFEAVARAKLLEMIETLRAKAHDVLGELSKRADEGRPVMINLPQ